MSCHVINVNVNIQTLTWISGETVYYFLDPDRYAYYLEKRSLDVKTIWRIIGGLDFFNETVLGSKESFWLS